MITSRKLQCLISQALMNFNHGTVRRGKLAERTGCGTTQKVPVHVTPILSSNYDIDVKGFVDKALDKKNFLKTFVS